MTDTDPRALVERLTGFTPGPWEWSRGHSDWGLPRSNTVMPQGVSAADFDKMIAEVHSQTPYCAGASLKDIRQSAFADANAALIAAAPDLHAALTAALDEIERLETRIRSLDHALNFILSDAAWTPKHPACESIINRINALRKGADQ